MDDSPKDVIGRELGSTERLLWAGRPREGLLLRGADAFQIPFSLLWTAFSVYWLVGSLTAGADMLFSLWGVPFVLVGLYMTVGRFWVEARQRAATVYGVTSERVIIVSGLFSREVKSLCLETLSDVSLTERASGRGTVVFGPVPPGYGWHSGGNWSTPGMPTAPSFECVEHAREAYDAIRAAQRSARRQTSLSDS